MSLIVLLGAEVIHSHVNSQLRGNRAKMAKVPCRQCELHTTKVQKHDSSVKFSLEVSSAMPETMPYCMCLGWSKHKTTFQSRRWSWFRPFRRRGRVRLGTPTTATLPYN